MPNNDWKAKAKSWRGEDGESDMTPDDWAKRCHEQALAMREGGSWDLSSPDDDGIPTGGCYNADYADEYHDECNRRLDEDEHYEAEQEQAAKGLFRWFLEQ